MRFLSTLTRLLDIVRNPTSNLTVAVLLLAVVLRSGELPRPTRRQSLLLGVLGGAAGVALAHFGLQVLIALAPKEMPRLQEYR